jgi:hypothetical protein
MATWRTADKQSCRVPPTCQHGAVKVTADDIAQLLASPPPRRVPAHVAKAIKGGKGVWFTVLFGLFFGSFGMIFVWIFFPWRLGDEWQLRGGGAREVSGHVREVSATSMSVNEQRVYEYRFAYTPEDGTPRSAVCFATGRDWAGGREVPVRYLPARPQVALIEGASLNQGGMFGAFTIIFPLIGYGMAIGSLVLRGNPTRLLREGAVAEVDVLSVEGTNMTVNNRPVHRITVSAPGAAGGPPVVLRRLDPADINLARRHAEQKQPLYVLYDPRKPARMVFPEALLEP